MATISLSYAVSASDQARVVAAAYQVEANADLNATANASQVLAYIQNKVVKSPIVSKVKSYETQVAQDAATAGITAVTLT